MTAPRRPRAAETSGAIPALDEVRAPSHAGALAMAAVSVAAASAAVLVADEPTCGASRAEEVVAHAEGVASAARRAEVVSALREVGVAMGWLRHPTTRGVESGVHTAGVAMPVETTPPVTVAPPVEQSTADGQMMVVRPQRPQGGPPHTTPRPITARGRRAAVHPDRDPPSR